MASTRAKASPRAGPGSLVSARRSFRSTSQEVASRSSNPLKEQQPRSATSQEHSTRSATSQEHPSRSATCQELPSRSSTTHKAAEAEAVAGGSDSSFELSEYEAAAAHRDSCGRCLRRVEDGEAGVQCDGPCKAWWHAGCGRCGRGAALVVYLVVVVYLAVVDSVHIVPDFGSVHSVPVCGR